MIVSDKPGAIQNALAQMGGVTSAKDLDAEGFTAMTGYFEYIGFTLIAAKGAELRAARRHGILCADGVDPQLTP